MYIEKNPKKNIDYSESIINTIREPLIALDQDLRVVSVSRSFYKFFKVKPEETVGQLIYDLGNKQWNIPKLRELLETILPHQTTFNNYEVEHDFATIGRKIMLLNARQIEQASGKEKIILLAIEDITERKAIEDGLEKTRKELAVIKKLADEANAFAESVINTIREPLIALDQDLRVVSVSRSFYDFFKVKPEDTVGELIYNLGNNQWDIPKLRELLETILPQKTTFDNYEVEHDFATIGRRIMLLNARQIEQASGKEKIILLAIEDITEKKHVEEEMRTINTELERKVMERTAALQNAYDEMEAFTYSVSHDLRSPLRATDGFSQALLEDYGDTLDATAQDYLSRIRSASQKMGGLIDDLLQLSRQTRTAMIPSTIDLGVIARQIISELTRQNPERHVDFKINGDMSAYADANLMHIALDNLIGNAWKYSSLHKEATIEFGSMIKNGEKVFYIRDDGAGFDMAYVEKLFKPFQRLHTVDEFAGNGIGLAMISRIIKRHLGRVWAQGEIEKGSTFFFTLGLSESTYKYTEEQS